MSYRTTRPDILTAAIATILLAADKDSAGGTATEELVVTDLATFLANHPIIEVTHIELKKLVIDAGTQPRVAIDNDVVQEYGELVKSAAKEEQPNPFDNLPDDKLPTVFRDATGRCVLADGFHRYGGHKMAHEKEMKVAIREGSERDALIFSLSTNKEHGVRRTRKDVDRALKIALKDPDLSQSSNVNIARHIGCSEFKVRDTRKVTESPSVRTVVKGGKVRKMDTSAIGKGKGGGKKGKAAAAKKSKGKTLGVTVEDDTKGKGGMGELHREITKIKNMIGGKLGDEFVVSVEDGSLELSKRDIRDWAGFSEQMIRKVAPLVLSRTFKPFKAMEFLKGGIDEKTMGILNNLAIGSGGTYTQKGDGFTVTVERKK